VSDASVDAQFIAGSKAPILVLLRKPRAAPDGCVLVVPPFAEEMNKCRRMVTVTALALAKRGVATLVPDLHGTGDSGGEFEEADWSTWLTDLERAAAWCARQGYPITGVLAIRLGAALGATALASGLLAPAATTVLWQPVFDGKRWLTQFLRLRIAAALAEQDKKETMQELLTRLRSGAIVEVAGYGLSGRMATDLESLGVPDVLPAELGTIHWFEVIRTADMELSPMAAQMRERARVAARPVVTQTLVGEPFWASTEIVCNECLAAATAAAFVQ
jgi:exosortase A-associated hydrolase 2